MAKQIYQTRNGVRVALTARDVKAYVMKERGWTSEQYNKEYDKLRNRLRAYEAFQRQSGVEVEKQSPASLLYFESRARKREGAEYQPTLELQRVQSFPSVSSGKALKSTLERRSETFARRYRETTDRAFAGLIAANPTAAEIAARVTDPVKREQALKALADKLHAKQDAAGRVQASSAIPFGQAVGSDDALDFDIEEYL